MRYLFWNQIICSIIHRYEKLFDWQSAKLRKKNVSFDVLVFVNLSEKDKSNLSKIRPTACLSFSREDFLLIFTFQQYFYLILSRNLLLFNFWYCGFIISFFPTKSEIRWNTKPIDIGRYALNNTTFFFLFVLYSHRVCKCQFAFVCIDVICAVIFSFRMW